MKKYIAEFLGTFALALAVALSLAGKFPVPTPALAAITLGVCVYTFGGISGTHINPAITIGLLTVGRIKILDAVGYIVAQFAGAAVARYATGALLGSHPPVTVINSAAVFAGEALGAFWLAIGVISVVTGKAPSAAAGLVIGGSLLVGITFAAPVSNAVLNPAVALAIGSLSVMYVVGTLIGAVAAMLLYNFVLARD